MTGKMMKKPPGMLKKKYVLKKKTRKLERFLDTKMSKLKNYRTMISSKARMKKLEV
jgi:hypothetical protein